MKAQIAKALSLGFDAADGSRHTHLTLALPQMLVGSVPRLSGHFRNGSAVLNLPQHPWQFVPTNTDSSSSLPSGLGSRNVADFPALGSSVSGTSALAEI
jgi:hypothetical protein